MPGVELVGNVTDSRDVLSRAALVPFPCPTSSGPKVKVLEAFAHGLPVVTTAAGLEGIALDAEVARPMVALKGQFVDHLAALFQDPEERGRLGKAARESVVLNHSPMAAAQARLAAFEDAFDL